MGYSIIFKTVIVKANDGRILHFSRQGCNNDNYGRNENENDLTIYESEADFVAFAEDFKRNSKPITDGGNFDIKIGSRPASMFDYGAHLLRMLKRAKTEETAQFKGRELIGQTLTDFTTDESIIIYANDSDYWKKYYDFIKEHKPHSVWGKNLYKSLNTISELLTAYDNGADFEKIEMAIA